MNPAVPHDRIQFYFHCHHYNCRITQLSLMSEYSFISIAIITIAEFLNLALCCWCWNHEIPGISGELFPKVNMYLFISGHFAHTSYMKDCPPTQSVKIKCINEKHIGKFHKLCLQSWHEEKLWYRKGHYSEHIVITTTTTTQRNIGTTAFPGMSPLHCKLLSDRDSDSPINLSLFFWLLWAGSTNDLDSHTESALTG